MSCHVFYCRHCLDPKNPTTRRLTLVSYSYANQAGTGTFCSGRCADLDRERQLQSEGPQLLPSPEDQVERYWRFRSQVGQSDPTVGGQVDA